MSSTDLKSAIRLQRKTLAAMLASPLDELAHACSRAMDLRGQGGVEKRRTIVEATLCGALVTLENCKHLFALDARGEQFVDNVTRDGPDAKHFGRNRLDRPYMEGVGYGTDFVLSEAYISRNSKRPMLTAVQVVRGSTGQILGYIGADFDLRELPGTVGLYPESQAWRQIKGDPAIRGGLFAQQRAQSLMDDRLDDILPLMSELITEHGVFHGKLHFSSSRATIWMVDDPYSYRILSFDDMIDPDICLAYPRRPYFERAVVDVKDVLRVYEMFRELRFADENIYLRAGSLNVVNGMIGLNFSCDGSHYLRYDEFLANGLDFWFGTYS